MDSVYEKSTAFVIRNCFVTYFSHNDWAEPIFVKLIERICRCGKLLKSEIDAQAHAARTQHDSFSESTEEIKPLTEEEKKQQLEK